MHSKKKRKKEEHHMYNQDQNYTVKLKTNTRDLDSQEIVTTSLFLSIVIVTSILAALMPLSKVNFTVLQATYLKTLLLIKERT